MYDVHIGCDMITLWCGQSMKFINQATYLAIVERYSSKNQIMLIRKILFIRLLLNY